MLVVTEESAGVERDDDGRGDTSSSSSLEDVLVDELEQRHREAAITHLYDEIWQSSWLY